MNHQTAIFRLLSIPGIERFVAFFVHSVRNQCEGMRKQCEVVLNVGPLCFDHRPISEA